MAVTRADLVAALSVIEPDALSLVLDASGVSRDGAETSAALAERIAGAIWWNYATPLGYVMGDADLEDIVRHVARRLGVGPDEVSPADDAWTQLGALTHALVKQIPDDGVRVETLDETSQRRLRRSILPTLAIGSSAGTSVAAWWGSGKLLELFATPIGRILPLLPAIGPYLGAIRTATGAVRLVSGPLGLALSVLTVNQALGTSYRKLVPLLLGVGALGPSAVEDAREVDAPVGDDPVPEV